MSDKFCKIHNYDYGEHFELGCPSCAEQGRYISEIPKRPELEQGLYVHNWSELYEHEHAVAKALWEVVNHRFCSCQTIDGTVVLCSRCKVIERVKASGWTP